MRRIIFSLLLLLSTITALVAQENFRDTQNPQYWKNHKPYEGYWQQDVHYKIKADINEKTHILSGYEELTYTNNSPDELTCVYFRLTQNAFTKGSYMEQQWGKSEDVQWGNYQEKGLGIVVEKIISSGSELKTELDNTILKVWLNHALKPGESILFAINFKTYFDPDAQWGRMQVYNSWGFDHYNGAHWYPRISVYDRKSGWTTDQHLGHEFYGDFGSYDVELTFPSNFIVDATGVLQNQEQVMPADLRAKLDIKNFKDKKWNEAPSVIIPYDSTQRKTWKFKANNVHDFAFLADPTFRIGEEEWNGIKCVALVQEPHASRWQTAPHLTKRIIEYYSGMIGMYEYPKIIVSDAEQGMEYPMLTMDSGEEPEFTYLLAHEVGHNWFFGMVGNNETYQPLLDEGFTTFISTLATEMFAKDSASKLNRIINDNNPRIDFPDRYYTSYREYMQNAIMTDGAQMNIHSDNYISDSPWGGPYHQVYSKGSAMLFNLQYVLGDSLFFKALSNYFQEWKFCHPYIDDFRSSVIRYTKTDLTWFFDQWINTNRTIDYSVGCIKKGKEKNEHIITFKRKGDMQMPIDFCVKTKEDSVINFHIPNTWFQKDTKATVLPKWTGFANLNRKYKAHVTVPDGIRDVKIDTSFRLADVNMLNNSKMFPISYYFDNFKYQVPSWKGYDMYARPDAWWNGFDGARIGFHMDGSYMQAKHFLDLNFWFNTGFGQQTYDWIGRVNKNDDFSVWADYYNTLDKFSKNTGWGAKIHIIDGMYNGRIFVDRTIKNNYFQIGVRSLFRADSNDRAYLLYPDEWSLSTSKNSPWLNNAVSFLYRNYQWYKNGGNTLDLSFRSAAFTDDFNFSKITLCNVNSQKIGKLNLKTRLFGQLGFGEDWPIESMLYLAGANPEEMMDNKFSRSVGFVDRTWLGYGIETNHFQMGGGLNLRGYAGYLGAEEDEYGNVLAVYKGNTGCAINAELEFDRLIPIRPRFLRDVVKIKSYLFGDAGMINISEPDEMLQMCSIRADAGLGFALSIKNWGPFDKVKPFTIRFDMPFFLNRIPAVEKDYLMFRYVVGINRAF